MYCDVANMDWIKDTQKAINYMEMHLLENISIDDVSNHVFSSSDYFNKVFRIVTGFSVSEYRLKSHNTE